MQSIVIAGNGPSLAQIDYSRLPQDFDVFRCNQFYFEDKYFLGKKIKGVFFNHKLIREFFYTIQLLRKKGEYEIEDLYAPLTPFFAYNQTDLEYFKKLKLLYPTVIDFYPFLTKNKIIFEWIQYFFLYHNKFLNMGTYMLITALAQGYKEIYLTGIDFYYGGGGYAFNMQNKYNLFQKIPEFNSNEPAECHTCDFDMQILKIIRNIDGVKIFSLSPNSPIVEIFPLAPSSSLDFEVVSKTDDFIDDLQNYPANANVDLFFGLEEKKEKEFLLKIKKMKDFLVSIKNKIEL